MVKRQLKGKYIPDKDGKLKPFLELSGTTFSSEPVSFKNPFLPKSIVPTAWPGRVWYWVKTIIKAASL